MSPYEPVREGAWFQGQIHCLVSLIIAKILGQNGCLRLPPPALHLVRTPLSPHYHLTLSSFSNFCQPN